MITSLKRITKMEAEQDSLERVSLNTSSLCNKDASLI
jgi:hypothetical protein